MKKYYLSILLLPFVSACGTIERESHIENGKFEDKTQIEDIHLDSAWECRDYVYDDQIALEIGKTNITVADIIVQNLDEDIGESDSLTQELEDNKELEGFLNKLNEIYGGFIRLAGEEADAAFYSRQGLNHRWEWDDNYVFIIEPSGRGYYYDFSNVAEGESVRPSDSFKCIRK